MTRYRKNCGHDGENMGSNRLSAKSRLGGAARTVGYYLELPCSLSPRLVTDRQRCAASTVGPNSRCNVKRIGSSRTVLRRGWNFLYGTSPSSRENSCVTFGRYKSN